MVMEVKKENSVTYVKVKKVVAKPGEVVVLLA